MGTAESSALQGFYFSPPISVIPLIQERPYFFTPLPGKTIHLNPESER